MTPEGKPAVFSRRAFLSRLAGVAAVAVATPFALPGATKPSAGAGEIMAYSPPAQAAPGEKPKPVETEQISNYDVSDLAVAGNTITALAEIPGDSSRRVFTGALTGPTDNLTLKEIWKTPFYPTAIVVSETNPDIMLVTGSHEKWINHDRPLYGRLGLSTDRGQSWQIFEHGGTEIMSVQITPDNKYAFVTEPDPLQEGWPGYWRFDLAAKMFTKCRMDINNPVTALTNMRILSVPDSYSNYSLTYLYSGYFKNTFRPDNTIEARQFNADKYSPNDTNLYWFTDKLGRIIVLVKEWQGGIPPNNEDRSVLTVHYNIDDIPTYRVQPKESLYYDQITSPYTTSENLTVTCLLADPDTDTGYMTSTVGRNKVYYPHIETFSLSDPANFDLRQRIPEDGAWPEGGRSGSTGARFYMARLGAEKHLAISFNLDLASDSGIYLRRITAGIRQADPWKKAVLQLQPVHKVYAPFIIRR